MIGLDTYIEEGLLTSPPGDMEKEGLQILHAEELRAYVAETAGRFSDITRHFDEYVDWVDENTIDLHSRGVFMASGWAVHDSKFPAPDWLRIRNLGIRMDMTCRLARSKAPECWPQTIVTNSYGPTISFFIHTGVRSLEGYRFNFQNSGPSYSGFIYLQNDGVHNIEIPHLDFKISGNCQRVYIRSCDSVTDIDTFSDIRVTGSTRVALGIPNYSFCWASLSGEFSESRQENHRMDKEVDRLLSRLPKGIDMVHITYNTGDGSYRAMYNKDKEGNDIDPIAYHRIGNHFVPTF